MRSVCGNPSVGPTTKLDQGDQVRILEWWKEKLLSSLRGGGLNPRQREDRELARRLRAMGPVGVHIAESNSNPNLRCLFLAIPRRHWSLLLEANRLDKEFGLPFSELARFTGEIAIGVKPDEFVTIFGKREEKGNSILLNFRAQEVTQPS